MACTPLVGRTLDAVSPRLMTLAGAAIMAAGFWLVSLAQAFWQVAALYCTLIAVGAAFAGLLPAQTVVLRRLPKNAGAILGVMVLGLSLGGGLLALALAPLLETFGWRPTFALAGLVILIVVVPLAWIFLDGKAGRGARGHGAPDASAPAAGDTPLMTTRQTFMSPSFWTVLVGFLSLTLVSSAVQPNVVAVAVDAGLTATQGAYLVSVMGLTAALGAPGIGWVADRIDPRTVFAGVAVALALALAAIVWVPLLFIPAIAVVGFAAGGGQPLLGVLILGRFGPGNFPRVQGLVIPLLLPALTGPALAGWIRDRTGSYDLAFLALIPLMAVSVLVISCAKALGRPRAAAPIAAQPVA
jgi:MFS family permease